MAKPRRNSRAVPACTTCNQSFVATAVAFAQRAHATGAVHEATSTARSEHAAAAQRCLFGTHHHPPIHQPHTQPGCRHSAERRHVHVAARHIGARWNTCDTKCKRCVGALQSRDACETYCFWELLRMPSLSQWPALYLRMHVIQDHDTRRFLLLISLLSVEWG